MSTNKLNSLKIYVALGLSLSLPSSALAQANIGDLFGAIIKHGMEQEQRNRMLQHQQQLAAEAQQSWARIEAPVRACLTRAIERRGTSVTALTAQGIMPDDPRILSPQAREGCQQLSSVSLGKNISCRVTSESGALVESKCNERLARREVNGAATEISPEEAISIVLSGGQLTRTQVETDTARSARLEAAAAAKNREVLQRLQGTIKPFVTSSLDRVRVRAVAINDRIARSIRSAQLSAEEVDKMSAESDALVAFERAEDARVSALEAAGERYVETSGVSGTEASAVAEAY